MACVRGKPDCLFEFRMSLVNMHHAFKRAQLLTAEKSPYPIPVYPYVWRADPNFNKIELEMGLDDNSNRRVAKFLFEIDTKAPGVLVHVAVYIIHMVSDPWVLPSMDSRLHGAAVLAFQAALRRMPAEFVIAPETPPAPQTNPLPPPPPDDRGEPLTI